MAKTVSVVSKSFPFSCSVSLRSRYYLPEHAAAAKNRFVNSNMQLLPYHLSASERTDMHKLGLFFVHFVVRVFFGWMDDCRLIIVCICLFVVGPSGCHSSFVYYEVWLINK